MKKTKTLNFYFILTTFLILVATAIISVVMVLVVSHFELGRYFRYSPWFGFFLIVFSSVIIGTLISFLVGQQILRPLNEVITATKEVSKGNFSVRVTSPGGNMEMETLVTNFNQMVAELNNVEIIHNDFINNFSHEFKTPIMSIQGFAKQLQGDDLSSTERQEFMEIIVSESRRLTHLASNILQLSNLENQEKIGLNQSQYSLSEQLRNCLVILQQEWEEKELVLELEIEEVEFFGDKEMLVSLWLNLLHNSIKFSHQGGILAVSCYVLGRQVKVRVRDEGIGMSDQVRQNIFNKFYQGDPARQIKGSGLGLPIAKQIAELHQGRLSVKSVEGVGTTFTVIFER